LPGVAAAHRNTKLLRQSLQLRLPARTLGHELRFDRVHSRHAARLVDLISRNGEPDDEDQPAMPQNCVDERYDGKLIAVGQVGTNRLNGGDTLSGSLDRGRGVVNVRPSPSWIHLLRDTIHKPSGLLFESDLRVQPVERIRDESRSFLGVPSGFELSHFTGPS
jgi:hypothetical protein